MQSSACSMQQQHAQPGGDTDGTQLLTHSSRRWLCRGPGSVGERAPTQTHTQQHTQTLCTAPSHPHRRQQFASAVPAQHPLCSSPQRNQHPTHPPGVPPCMLHGPLQNAACPGLSCELLLLAAVLTALPHAAAAAHVPEGTPANMMQSVVHCACLNCKHRAASHIARRPVCLPLPALAQPFPCGCPSVPALPTNKQQAAAATDMPGTCHRLAPTTTTTTINNQKHTHC